MSMVTYAYDITPGFLIHNNHNTYSLLNLVSKNMHLTGRSTDVKIASRLAMINLVASTSAHFDWAQACEDPIKQPITEPRYLLCLGVSFGSFGPFLVFNSDSPVKGALGHKQYHLVEPRQMDGPKEVEIHSE
ncbi:hypothetical protein NW761_001805 [Fusarium oxysporum]|nr:hypothetical protein NW758_000302 [Fusarium oxysporum]KAJ4061178.1 hypothetical protein NW753_005427 [Fusarium oxysporum]KAJ4063549.1 hypothetical protein NW763_003822 [Fusarium oxysporum]KAJ4103016.1 hypothetical protein NW761_001805 [Fusarium oxysporum]KAJ4105297.1 hypothetical protein NW756_001067 [Fusarium oxysporum]